MFTSILLVLGGFALLILGGETLLRGAVGLATWLRLTPAVIGLTVVAGGTSVPELAVSATAAWNGSTEIAVANVVGSTIFNTLCIVGLGGVLRSLAVGGNTVCFEYPVLLLTTVLCIVVCEDGVIGRMDAVLMLSVYVLFTMFLIYLVRAQMSRSEAQEYRGEVQELAPSVDGPPLAPNLALIVAGVALLTVGAHLTVTGSATIARLLGMTERVIGLTIVAAGTSLPEVVTTLVSAYHGRDDIAVANVIGSNIFNILVILGLSSLISPLPVPQQTVSSDNWWMLASVLLLLPLLITGRRIARWEGALLLATYAVYLIVVLKQ